MNETGACPSHSGSLGRSLETLSEDTSGLTYLHGDRHAGKHKPQKQGWPCNLAPNQPGQNARVGQVLGCPGTSRTPAIYILPAVLTADTAAGGQQPWDHHTAEGDTGYQRSPALLR